MTQIRKKFMTLSLFAISVTGAFAQAVGSDFKVGEITYTVTKNDLQHHSDNFVSVAYIGGKGDVTVPSTVTHPENHEVYKVKESTNWTSCSDDITSLTFSEGYTTMNDGCYRCAKSLKKVTLPASFTSLGKNCFENCPAFVEYKVADGNATYSNNADGWLISKDAKTLVSFPSGKQGNVNIPEGITTLAPTTFMVCKKVEKITLPSTLTKIDQTLSASFFAVGTWFEVSTANPAFQSINGVLCSKDGKTLVTFPAHYAKEKLTDGKYTVPASVETINSEAFCQTEDYLKAVDLSNTKTLEKEAFNWANGLESVTIGRYVSDIKSGAFLSCPVLKRFTVDENNVTYSGKDDIIYSKNQEKLILCPTAKEGEYDIPEGTKSVEEKAFYNSHLKKVNFPSSLESIGNESFRFSYLEQLDFGENSHLKHIGSIAFSDCKDLTGNVTIPATVEVAEGQLFNYTKISSIHIAAGSKLKRIAWGGFMYMGELEQFIFDGENSLESIGERAFDGDSKLKKIEIPSGVTTIDNSAFINTPSLETVTFKEPATITFIGKGAFGNSGIKSITLPESVKEIKEQAFDNCKNLKTIRIPKNVNNIETGAFNFCEKLENFDVAPDNETYSSVDGILCSKDKKTLKTFPAGKADSRYTSLPYFEKIGAYAFYNSKNITNITIPRTVTTIDTRAFALCDNLSSLSFMGKDNVPELSENIMYSSPKPGNVYIYVRKAWYENDANKATVEKYNGIFKEVHPSFIVESGYDRGLEFFPTSNTAAGVVSFAEPRTSVIIQKTATEKAYTDKYNKQWNEKTYDVSAILDFAFEASTPSVKMVTVLADISNIGVEAFRAPTLNELYFVGDVPATLSSTAYNLPDKYPFKEGLTVYVKQSKQNDYGHKWNVDGHGVCFQWQIPAKTLASRATACYPFDVVYDNTKDVKPYVTLRLDPNNFNARHLQDGTAFVWSRSIDDYTVPAFQPVLLVSKQSANVESYCQMKETQNAAAIDKTGYTDYMLGTVEDTHLENKDGYTLYGLSKSGLFKKIAAAGNNLTWFKAYLKIPNTDIPAGAKSIAFLFEDENNTTGIQELNTAAETGKAPYYDLNGIKVEKPQHGIYIHNNKKVVIK
ncbi:leucine-rich repeat domain-containing protein [Prevotella denticola]|uniref:leucine-rich repeat domain-containing protein n=1 Tax=Prevotella denticola TaxID=28129 RepID=UPI001BA80F15|nr:leucine-rich repeat domain-containing protein [Prevotella denticola]QUB91193.1 leucine-rich repeat protein [Prevotella denticola]